MKSIIKWWNTRRRPKTITVQVLAPPSETATTSAEWRANPAAVDLTSKLFKKSEMRTILQILEDESPMKTIGDQMSIAAPEREQASLAILEQGYRVCLNKLKSLGVVNHELQDIPMTFEADAENPQSN